MRQINKSQLVRDCACVVFRQRQLTLEVDGLAQADADGVVRGADAVETHGVLQRAASSSSSAARAVAALEAQVRAGDCDQLTALRRARHGRD